MRARLVAPGIWRLPFRSSTLPPFEHTNGWLIVSRERAVLVDPGFRDGSGLAMLEGALNASGATTLEAVWLTHTHRDHCEGLAAVRDRWPGSEVGAHEFEAGRLDLAGTARTLGDGDSLTICEREVRVLHTPGHSPGHLAFRVVDVGWTLVGDLLAGHGSVWVGAPEGDVADYLRSLDRIASEPTTALAPGHGDPLTDPGAAIRAARIHRLHREAQIVAALRRSTGGATLETLRAAVYPDLEPRMEALAERSLQAHLTKLVAEARAVRTTDEPQGPYLPVD